MLLIAYDIIRRAVRAISQGPVMFSDIGSGVGKGGGAGGSIREAGGSFGRMEAVREEEFIRRKERQQKERMMANKANLSDMNAKESTKKEDIIFVEPQAQQDNIFVDEDAIQKTKKNIEELQKNGKCYTSYHTFININANIIHIYCYYNASILNCVCMFVVVLNSLLRGVHGDITAKGGDDESDWHTQPNVTAGNEWPCRRASSGLGRIP